MPVTPGADGQPRLRGHQRIALMHDLADSHLTYSEIAIKYGRSESSIYSFKKNHAAEIDALRADMSDEFAALWVAKKVNRVATYQDDIESLEDSEDPGAISVKHRALRSVAEEMGQLTTKQEIQAAVQYQVVGVDIEKMK